MLNVVVAVHAVEPQRIAPSSWPSWLSIIGAGTLIFAAYEGFELIANTSASMQDYQRLVLRAHYISVMSVIILQKQRRAFMDTLSTNLATSFAENWSALLARGIVAILFGLLTWIMPGVTLAALVLLFGFYTLVDGVIGFWLAIKGRKENEHWWALLLWAFCSIAVGILTFFAPGVTEIVLLLYVAAWAIVTGVLEIISGIRLRKEIKGEWMFILAGLASVIFGVIMMAQPAVGALALLWMIAAYAIFFGCMLIMLAFKVRSLREKKVQSS